MNANLHRSYLVARLLSRCEEAKGDTLCGSVRSSVVHGSAWAHSPPAQGLEVRKRAPRVMARRRVTLCAAVRAPTRGQVCPRPSVLQRVR